MKPKDINWFMKEGLLEKKPFIARLAPNYLRKARNNLVTMSILSELYENSDAAKSLNPPSDYDPSEWIVNCGYYAMYMAAMAALSNVNYKSKNHAATSLALKTFFVEKKLLESEYLEKLEKVNIQKSEVEHLNFVKSKREIAQYSPTKETSKRIAEEVMNDAYEFVDRFENLVNKLTL